MLRKKETFTVITPIPGFIPRQLAIDILHSHSEVITLNPLVLSHRPIPAPRDAASDEFYSTWYEIHERVQIVPGIGKAGGTKISFNGCFHDMPWGLQTHIYAPFNIDMRNKYTIAGNQPGMEPPENMEIGLADLGAPKDGLYLREDIEIKCNVTMTSFVKSQMKAASKEMVQRIIKKAELLDAGILQAMMHEGKLRTVNPNDRSSTMAEKMGNMPGGMGSPPLTATSPGFPMRAGSSAGGSNPSSPRPFPASPGLQYTSMHHHQGSGQYFQQQQQQQGQYPHNPHQSWQYGNQGPTPPPKIQQGQHDSYQSVNWGEQKEQMAPVEMPGDYHHHHHQHQSVPQKEGGGGGYDPRTAEMAVPEEGRQGDRPAVSMQGNEETGRKVKAKLY